MLAGPADHAGGDADPGRRSPWVEIRQSWPAPSGPRALHAPQRRTPSVFRHDAQSSARDETIARPDGTPPPAKRLITGGGPRKRGALDRRLATAPHSRRWWPAPAPRAAHAEEGDRPMVETTQNRHLDDLTGKTSTCPLYSPSVGPDSDRTSPTLLRAGGRLHPRSRLHLDPSFLGGKHRSTYIRRPFKGELLHRGYPIEPTGREIPFPRGLLPAALRGNCPRRPSWEKFETTITHHTMIHEQMGNGFFFSAASAATPIRWRSWWGTVPPPPPPLGAMSAFYHRLDRQSPTNASARSPATA